MEVVIVSYEVVSGFLELRNCPHAKATVSRGSKPAE